MFALFGYLSGFFAAIEYIPYIKDIRDGKVKPHRATFLIWTILGGIAFFSQFAKGASNSLWLPGVETILGLIVFFLSFRFGVGGYSKQDRFALAVAFIALVAWYFTKEAAIALYITIFIDAIGSYLIMHKAYHMPETETALAWILSAISGFCALLAVGKLDIILISYPLYIIISNISVVLAMQVGNQKKVQLNK